jgi:hypothetical protein
LRMRVGIRESLEMNVSKPRVFSAQWKLKLTLPS